MASHLHDKENEKMVQTAAVSNRLRRRVTLLGGPKKTVPI